MSVSFDSRELTQVIDALAKAAEVAPAAAMAMIKKGAVNVQKDVRARWSGYPHAPQLPAAVTFDTYQSLRGPAAEVGPDKTKPQGALGNIFEYGTPKNAPIPGLAPAGRAEEPRMAAAAEAMMLRALGLG